MSFASVLLVCAALAAPDSGAVAAETAVVTAAAETSVLTETDMRRALGEECLQRGIAAVNAQRYVAAILAFREAAMHLPDNPQVLFNLATAYYLNNDLANAEAQYLAVTRLRPEDAEALTYLGITRALQGKRRAALADWRRALELDPHNELAQQQLSAYDRRR